MFSVLVVALLVFHNLCLAQEWKLQTSGVLANLRDVYFVNSSYGWIVGDGGTILHTSDGGTTWVSQVIEENEDLKALSFVDTLTGWVVGKNGALFHTSDGGKGWTRQDSKTVLSLNDVHFVNRNTGWAIGGMQTSDNGIMGVIIGTTDGGNSWNELVDPKRGGYLGMFFWDEKNGWVVGGKRLLDNFDEDIILHTTNSGVTWEEQYTPRIGPLRRVLFLDERTGWIVGDSPLEGGALRTIDGGLNWYQVKIQTGPILTTELFRGLAVVSDNIWISSVEDIYHSEDSGRTWKKEAHESEKLISSLFFSDLSNGWAIGESGSIWKYVGKPTSVQGINFDNQESFLDSNFPNPFNYGTQIRFSIKKDAHVVLNVFDAIGQKVATIIDKYQQCGSHAVMFDSKHLPSGVYYYQLTIDGLVETKRMILLR